MHPILIINAWINQPSIGYNQLVAQQNIFAANDYLEPSRREWGQVEKNCRSRKWYNLRKIYERKIDNEFCREYSAIRVEAWSTCHNYWEKIKRKLTFEEEIRTIWEKIIWLDLRITFKALPIVWKRDLWHVLCRVQPRSLDWLIDRFYQII